MKHFLLFLLLVAFLAGPAQAQSYKLAKDPAQFIPDVKTMMAATKNEAAIRVSTRLEEIWAGQQLSNAQKTLVVDISQQMLTKKLKARPHFEHFLGGLVSAVNIHKLSNAPLDQYLNVVQRSLQQDPVPAFEKFLATSASFLDTKILYKSQYNTLRVLNGSFSFAYLDGSEPLEAKPAPAKKAAAKAAKPGQGDPQPADAEEDPWALPPGSQGPALLGPVLKLQGIDLFFVSNGDSLQISQTAGQVQLTKGLFAGDQGLFKWQQPNGEATAAFKAFSFDISKAAFKAENVTLTYPAVLEAPVEGIFEYRSVRNKPNGESGYPKFVSYTNNARIKNIGENIQYLGGFTMAGSKVSTAALDGSPSDITVSAAGSPRFKATAANYALSDTLISSDLAAILIYQGKDSLTHPGIRLKYSKPTKTLNLTRNEQSQVSPFNSTYHQMEISAEMLTWNIEQPDVHFSILNAKNEVPARLTSKEYFTDTRYEHLQGTASFHPLIVIANYATRQKTNAFFLSELAQATKLEEKELAVAASMLARQNFLTFTSSTGLITLKPKALHYMKSAQGKKDYDFITLQSLAPSGKNATLDLQKNELLVRGVDKFYFTGDSVAVYAIPDSNQVAILKNRDIKFNGVVIASLFRFRGTKFTFKYDEFLVDMLKIDTIAFAVKKKQKQGVKGNNTGEQYLSNSISKSSGKLYLNKPDNKSGKKKLKNYPMFDATGGAYVYFNKPEILGGAYDTTVYFAIPPFKMDSLNAEGQGAVGFKGKFYSGGIFPPFETKLTLMEDQSLGFEYQAPKAGLAAYGGKGKFYNKLSMSNQGLQGSGQIDYLTAKLHSNAFTFYRDKVLTMGTKATVAEASIGDAFYMSANFNKYALEWLPQKDTMNISTTSEPIKLYQDKFTFRGISTITPKGFFGDGTIEGADGSIKSPILAFAKSKFKANNAVFEVKSKTPGKPALRATDVFMEYDLNKGYATFSPERTGVASTDFPYAQFKTSLRSGRWDVNKKKVTMDEPTGDKNVKAYFVSTRPAHDNLKFQARTASYDISRNTLTIGGVPYIASADAHIVPDSNMVYITANSDMKTFQRAAVITDTLHKYHQMYKGEIDIVSRTKYQGYSTANYVNALSDTFAVKFGKFNMKNMAVARPVAQAGKTVENDQGELVTQEKVRQVNTEILPEDSLLLASAAPPAKKGLFRKGSKKKKEVQPADSTGSPAPGLLADASGATKPKKSSWRNRKNKTEVAALDSTSLALGAVEEVKKDKRRSRKEEAEEGAIPEDAAYTAATATVKESDKFLIAPGVLYKGEITMNSIRQHWDFNGSVKLAFSDGQGASDWFPYQATVNPAEVQIDIKDPVAADGTPLKTGLHVSVANNKVYNTFVSKKKDDTDLDVFTVDGQLSYNKKKKEFRLGAPKRVSGEVLAGNLLVYNDSLDVSRYEGKFDLIRPVKNFSLASAGTAIAKPSEKRYTLQALMALQMPLPDQALEQLGKALAENTAGAAEASVDANSLPVQLAQFIGDKDAQAFAAKSEYTPLPGLGGEFAKSLVFSGVDLRWSDSTKAWYSKGKLNLSNILKKDINAQVPGYIEVKRGPDADVVNIYLEPLQSLWYHFNFDNNVLMVTSSDETFSGLVAKKRNSSLVMGEDMDKAAFVNYFRKNYLKDAKPEVVAPVVKETPQKAAGFDFDEEETAGKKKKKQDKEAAPAVPKADKAAKDKKAPEMALPGMTEEGKKKKKNKKEQDSLLPDVDLN